MLTSAKHCERLGDGPRRRERRTERVGEGGRKSRMKASEAAVGRASLARCFSTALAGNTCYQDDRTTSPLKPQSNILCPDVTPGQARTLGSVHSYAPDNRFMVSWLSHDAKAWIQPGTIESVESDAALKFDMASNHGNYHHVICCPVFGGTSTKANLTVFSCYDMKFQP